MKRCRGSGSVRFSILGAYLVFASGSVGAVEWSAEPYVSLRTIYTDNFTLTTDSHPDVFGAQFGPGLRLNAEAENWKVSTEANLRFNRYDESQFNTTEGALGLRSEYRAERNTYGLNAHFIRDNTLVGELATTGIAQSFSPRTEVFINPSFARALTESTKLVVGYDFTAVNYSDTTGTSLIDYREQRVIAGIEHSFTERTTGVLNAYYDFFETDPDNFKAHSVGAQAGIIQAFSETLRASLLAGPRTTHSTTSARAPVCKGPIINGVCQGGVTTLSSEVTSDSTGFTVTGDVTKRWGETMSINMRAGRELNPTGIGALVQTDLLRVALSRELSETWTAVLDAGIYRSKYVGTAIDANKARYLQVEPHVIWRVAPGWQVDAGYIYARQKYDTQPEAATANTVYVMLSYSWQKIARSR
jgi:hypothetical protein